MICSNHGPVISAKAGKKAHLHPAFSNVSIHETLLVGGDQELQLQREEMTLVEGKDTAPEDVLNRLAELP